MLENVWPTRLSVGSNEPWRGFEKLAEEPYERFDSLDAGSLLEIGVLPLQFFLCASEMKLPFRAASQCPMGSLIFAWFAAFLHLIFSTIEEDGTGMGTWLLAFANCPLHCFAVLSCRFLAWHTRRLSINSNFLAIVLLLPGLKLLPLEVDGKSLAEAGSFALTWDLHTGVDLMESDSAKISCTREGSLTSPDFTNGTFKSKHCGNSIISFVPAFRSIKGISLEGFCGFSGLYPLGLIAAFKFSGVPNVFPL